MLACFSAISPQTRRHIMEFNKLTQFAVEHDASDIHIQAATARAGPVPSKYNIEGRALELGDYIRGAGAGQQLFDQHLLHLYYQQLISHDEALRNATNRESLTMAMRGISKTGGGDAGRT
jgi:Tfp pilus assembly pilus retraction ATPase PilT